LASKLIPYLRENYLDAASKSRHVDEGGMKPALKLILASKLIPCLRENYLDAASKSRHVAEGE
ncbi:hypothetical protein, partial [Legionella wadsworthii]|uniref:hypothetical protein n=1 Tax=Legionella wadsworthii TaxID=28088 RepID=UPI0004E273D3